MANGEELTIEEYHAALGRCADALTWAADETERIGKYHVQQVRKRTALSPRAVARLWREAAEKYRSTAQEYRQILSEENDSQRDGAER